MSVVLEATDVRFAYGRGPDVLSGVSLALDEGSFTAIIGPNGCGKTTLLRLLTGAERPTSGAVTLGGQPIERWPPRERARRVAVVPQSTDVAFPYTVAELVRMGRTPHLSRLPFERPEDLEAADEAMRALDIFDLRDRDVTRCSGGERQRAIIARALAQQAPVLLLDEPASSLDLHHQVGLFTLLAGLQRRGATVAVVSHDLNLPAQLCTRVVLLDRGRVRAAGPVEEIYRRDVLEPVYRTRLAVGRHEATGAPYVLPITSRDP
jgi:iron complex transport system ATP-binding protein